MNQSKEDCATPRTDAAERDLPGGRWGQLVSSEFARALELELDRYKRANESLVRWKGEIDSHLIAHRVEFPDDYDDSPKWAVGKLIECEASRALSEERSGWISTGDKLPADEQRVLGWWPAGRNSTDGYDVVLYHAADAPDGPESWRYTDESSADAPGYWMPLEALGRPE